MVGSLMVCVLPRGAQAECSLKPYDDHFPYSQAALESRDAFYASHCDESFSELVMVPDPRLEKRVTPPSNRLPMANPAYVHAVQRYGLSGTAVFAYIVEPDGSVKHATILQSSGHPSLDDATLLRAKEIRFATPGKLDGLPVRVLMADSLTFKHPQSDGFPPVPFPDEVIASLGNRIIDYCNRGDVDGLYAEIDESAKARFSRADAKERLRIFNGVYGEISQASYYGREEPQVKADVPVFSLAYVLELERPGAENVYMSISVVDRGAMPRILDFQIHRGYLREIRAPQPRRR